MDENNYVERLKKAKRKREGRDPMHRFMNLATGVIVVLAVVLVTRIAQGGKLSIGFPAKEAETAAETAAESAAQETAADALLAEEQTVAETLSPEQLKRAVVDSYQNLGIANVEGFVNIRESAAANAKILGKLNGGAACEIEDTSTEGWYRIKSGGIDGYVASQFILTGDEAKQKAETLVKERAVVATDKLNIREAADGTSQIMGSALRNERYDILSNENGWIGIENGYISADYVKVEYALNEARQLDLHTAVLNMYDNMGISNVDTYLNIRDKAGEDGNIIGKMPGKAAGNILETSQDGQWYRIQSGPVTGYVKAEFIMTGDAAKASALDNAKLMAVVNTDVANARTEPNTNSKIWTQIANSEKYDVVDQDTDGWIHIQLDDDTAYVANDYVDVIYGLNEAVAYTPPAPEPPKEEKKKDSSKKSSPSSKSSTGSSIASYATQFLGNPYVWGGSSLTHGTDCSGFTMSVMAHYGVSLPHHAASQAQMGTKVSSGDLRAGDLVFYSNGGGINHVALYIGNGKVVHASNKKSGIKISTWNYRTPTTIRRYL